MKPPEGSKRQLSVLSIAKKCFPKFRAMWRSKVFSLNAKQAPDLVRCFWLWICQLSLPVPRARKKSVCVGNLTLKSIDFSGIFSVKYCHQVIQFRILIELTERKILVFITCDQAQKIKNVYNHFRGLSDFPTSGKIRKRNFKSARNCTLDRNECSFINDDPEHSHTREAQP
eukprot:g16524.t1